MRPTDIQCGGVLPSSRALLYILAACGILSLVSKFTSRKG